jgi:hypothetical protein
VVDPDEISQDKIGILMHILFLFLDGIGIGHDDPLSNPFSATRMPRLESLLGGKRIVKGITPISTPEVTLHELDACLGVPGMPQSATGQAVLLTGQNVAAELGYHYGPWPNKLIARTLVNGNLFSQVSKAGKRACFVNAYPPRYFEAIQSGKRSYSAIPLAVTSAGLALKTMDDLLAGDAISADFTSQGWHDHLGISNISVISPIEAGERLARLAIENEFTFFEYWLSDYVGHGQNMAEACKILEIFDQVLTGILARWDTQSDLILITSDHGNMEDMSTRRHTTNPVPALIIGAPGLRSEFCYGLKDLTGVAPAITNQLGIV